jgi:hypothetical protein
MGLKKKSHSDPAIKPIIWTHNNEMFKAKHHFSVPEQYELTPLYSEENLIEVARRLESRGALNRKKHKTGVPPHCNMIGLD